MPADFILSPKPDQAPIQAYNPAKTGFGFAQTEGRACPQGLGPGLWDVVGAGLKVVREGCNGFWGLESEGLGFLVQSAGLVASGLGSGHLVGLEHGFNNDLSEIRDVHLHS